MKTRIVEDLFGFASKPWFRLEVWDESDSRWNLVTSGSGTLEEWKAKAEKLSKSETPHAVRAIFTDGVEDPKEPT